MAMKCVQAYQGTEGWKLPIHGQLRVCWGGQQDEKGQQCLWWEITLLGDDLLRKVILNAYTVELVAVLQPLGVMQLSREEAEKKATEFLKDLKQIDKVEIPILLTLSGGQSWT